MIGSAHPSRGPAESHGSHGSRAVGSGRCWRTGLRTFSFPVSGFNGWCCVREILDHSMAPALRRADVPARRHEPLNSSSRREEAHSFRPKEIRASSRRLLRGFMGREHLQELDVNRGHEPGRGRPVPADGRCQRVEWGRAVPTPMFMGRDPRTAPGVGLESVHPRRV